MRRATRMTIGILAGAVVIGGLAAPQPDAGAAARPHGSVTLAVADNLTPAKFSSAGQVVTFTATATNTGFSSLFNVSISASALGSLTCTQPANLNPGASLICTGTHTISAADLTAGSFTVNASTTGFDSRGRRANDSATDTITGAPVVSPIQHVVVIYQENHSFDNVLGGICVNAHLACDGATTGKKHDGTTIPLGPADDIVAQVAHATKAQTQAIDGGKMDAFDLMYGCTSPTFACYTQYSPAQIPNLANLAQRYVISDRTFSENPVPSYGAHLQLIAGQMGGYTGDNPVAGTSGTTGQGWGCDSLTDAPWVDPANPTAAPVNVPACVPRQDGFGPYRASPVQYMPTIFNRLDAANKTWRLYAPRGITGEVGGYGWSVCPMFGECLYDARNANKPSPNWVGPSQFVTDASSGNLPAYSLVTPSFVNSQHNQASMLAGDNYIGQAVNAVMNGPQWQSTAIFITYDDCGCFYDHVAPPAGSKLGIRVPMVIVSPQARPGFVDHGVSSYASMLAFVEHNWGLPSLGTDDASAYDYCASFAYNPATCTSTVSGASATLAAAKLSTSQKAPAKVTLVESPIPKSTTDFLATHLADEDDPT